MLASPDLLPALDYEVELGMVLLENINWDRISSKDTNYCPHVGFFLANDLGARSVQVMGADLEDPQRFPFWSVSKSFPGCLQISEMAWIRAKAKPDGMVRVRLTSRLNGHVAQDESTTTLLLSVRDIFRHVEWARELRQHPRRG